MKTNQNMIRKMGSYDVIQRTSDGYFNATHLLKQWNTANPQEKREIDNFWKSTGLDRLMLEIVVNEFDINTQNFRDLKNSSSVKSTDDKTKLTFNELKSILSKTSKANKGANSGTSMHPILFIKFAMYLSPSFEYHVLKFVSDEMIKCRHEAGDEYKSLGSAIKKIVSSNDMQKAMKKIGEALNWIVFNSHEQGIRNKFGDEQKQRELSALERKVADLINEGFITDYPQVVKYLRKLYHEKNSPVVFKV